MIFACAMILGFIGLILVLIFWHTRKIMIPRVTLFILNILEGPIKQIIMLFRFDPDVIYVMLTNIRNNLSRDAFIKTPFKKRMIVIPACLRAIDCKAPLTNEGVKCLMCGKCAIKDIIEEADRLGYIHIVTPGTTLIKRMVKKYKPLAILGSGCSMEVKEGTAMISAIGLPVMTVTLSKDGCVQTAIDKEKLFEVMRLSEIQVRNRSRAMRR